MSYPYSPDGSQSDPTSSTYGSEAGRPMPAPSGSGAGSPQDSVHSPGFSFDPGYSGYAGDDSAQGVRPGSSGSAPCGSPGGGGVSGFGPTGPVDTSERSMAMLAHLSMIIGMLLSAGWLTFVGPLVLWFVYKDRSPFVRQASAGAFNFSLAASVAAIVAWLLLLTIIGIPVAIIIFIAVAVVTILFPILGAMKANGGEPYRYPFQIPVLT